MQSSSTLSCADKAGGVPCMLSSSESGEHLFDNSSETYSKFASNLT